MENDQNDKPIAVIDKEYISGISEEVFGTKLSELSEDDWWELVDLIHEKIYEGVNDAVQEILDGKAK